MAEIYQCHAQRIYHLLFRMVWQKETAQELMQDSFIDVMTKISSFRGESGLYAWIRRIAVNRCLMHFRKHKETLVELDFKNEPVSKENFEHVIDLESLCKKLTPMRRMVVWLHEIEGLTHKEIANLTGKSVSHSKTELSRAMEQLRIIPSSQLTGNSIDESKSGTKILKNLVNNEQTEVALCTPLLNNS